MMNRPSREPVADWRRQRDSHENVTNPLDTAWHQRFSGAATPPGRSQHIATCLNLMGDWRDSVRSQQSEKTGAVRVCRKTGGQDLSLNRMRHLKGCEKNA